MENQTLTSALESAGPAEPVAPTESAPQGQTPEGGTAPEFVGFSPEQPGQVSQEQQFKLAETLTPETVIAHAPDGKPITAAEFQNGYLRQSDYTRKTQEAAEQRKAHEEAIRFYEENQSYIQRMMSQDPAERAAVFEELRQNFQVPEPQTRQRDDRGRFAANQDEELYDLADLEDPDQIAFAQKHNAAVMRARNAEQSVKSLEAKFDQLMTGLTTAQQRAEHTDKAQAMAAEWRAKGMSADVDGALDLVGKPMSVEQAMQLHNLEAMLRHTHEVTRRQASGALPNEPGGGAARPSNTQGLSLSQRLEQGL